MNNAEWSHHAHHSSKLYSPACFENSWESLSFSSIAVGNSRSSSTTCGSILPTTITLTITILCTIS